ncbi:FAD-dependent monooxygenase [Variovorax sp. GB1P17]|uniref:FAD-dependent monooxygenase n=1 Tax=Variovorax sp. GB1P17 TaxID=3443740 RepID=UPI003F455797
MTHRDMQDPNPHQLPVAIVGAGPIGLTTALGLAYYGIPSVVYEDDLHLSSDTKAGTLLSRTLEIFRRYGVADDVLAQALRVDEIGEIDKRTQKSTFPVLLDALSQETRYPFVINLPQQDLEPILGRALERTGLIQLKMGHRLLSYEDQDNGAVLKVQTANGVIEERAAFLLACDGGRSTVREQMGIVVEGSSLPVKYALVDLLVDLDLENPRDYPYLAYFADPVEWMVLVRHPHCWRFLYPMAEGAEDPTEEELRDKSLSFIGEVANVKVLNKVTYRVHHRVATEWHRGRVFLMGDAAHLITPMWALGLNTGALDASNLPWRLSWLLRGWATEKILDGYEREQRPLAIHGSGEMAEAARLSMSKRGDVVTAMSDNNWSNAYTRTMLGVKLDVNGIDEWSMVTRSTCPAVTAGDRLPDYLVHAPNGRQVRIHDQCAGQFTALYFSDARRRPEVPVNDSPALRHYVVSRYDAPHDSGLRDRSLLDPGNAFFKRLGIPADTLVLVRPDEHIAAIVPMRGGDGIDARHLYEQITGLPPFVQK